jgi:hypothetical protein
MQRSCKHDFPKIERLCFLIKSRRMRWVGDVARMGEKKNACRILTGRIETTRKFKT